MGLCPTVQQAIYQFFSSQPALISVYLYLFSLVEKLISHKDIENNSICIEVLKQKREKAETFSLLPQTIVNAHCVCIRILAILTAKLVENLIQR